MFLVEILELVTKSSVSSTVHTFFVEALSIPIFYYTSFKGPFEVNLYYSIQAAIGRENGKPVTRCVSLLLCVKPQMDGESKLQATYKKSKTNGISVSKVSGSTKTSN